MEAAWTSEGSLKFRSVFRSSYGNNSFIRNREVMLIYSLATFIIDFLYRLLHSCIDLFGHLPTLFPLLYLSLTIQLQVF
jgi:hypothetical protein